MRPGKSRKCPTPPPRAASPNPGTIGAWRAQVRREVGGGGVGTFRGASRRATPRLAPRVRPHPPRGPGARRGRMGPEVGPAVQRRSRGPEFGILSVRLAETVSRHVYPKEKRVSGILIVGSHTKSAFFWQFSHFSHFFVTGGSKSSAELFTHCFRTAIRTAARARSGRANDTDGLWE
eukprot:gene16470-biopygen15824